MKQLKLDFNEINLLGDYDAAEVIDDGKFKDKTMHHSWSDTLSDDGKKIIKSHWFAYHLDHLKNMFPDAKFIGVQRTNEECFEWWHICGGWDISYPHYFWYKDDKRMKQQIAIENEYILDFFKEVKHYNITELFERLGLPNKTITWQEFCAKDAKLSEVLKYHQPKDDGDYEHALNFVVEKHMSAVL